MKYQVFGKVTGSVYVGEFEANSPEEARELAEASDGASVSFCHYCSRKCEDPEVEITSIVAEDGSSTNVAVESERPPGEGWVWIVDDAENGVGTTGRWGKLDEERDDG